MINILENPKNSTRKKKPDRTNKLENLKYAKSTHQVSCISLQGRDFQCASFPLPLVKFIFKCFIIFETIF